MNILSTRLTAAMRKTARSLFDDILANVRPTVIVTTHDCTGLDTGRRQFFVDEFVTDHVYFSEYDVRPKTGDFVSPQQSRPPRRTRQLMKALLGISGITRVWLAPPTVRQAPDLQELSCITLTLHPELDWVQDGIERQVMAIFRKQFRWPTWISIRVDRRMPVRLMDDSIGRIGCVEFI